MTRKRSALRIGIDLGGTKTEIVALADAAPRSGGDGALLRRRVRSPRGDYDATIATIAELVRAAEGTLGRTGSVGIGIPGSISPATGLVKNANSVWLNGRPLGKDLEAALARPVRIANDANCFALSEAATGAAAGSATVFGVILGTGVGGGYVVNGAGVAGANGIAGEWGHLPLPWRDAADPVPPRCWCGRTDCIETHLSGPALERELETAMGRPVAAGDAEELACRDPRLARVMDGYWSRLARALAMIVDILDPSAIVVGGGLSNLRGIYREVPVRWGAHVFSDRVNTPLLPPRHGDSSGVLGAARLWPAAGED